MVDFARKGFILSATSLLLQSLNELFSVEFASDNYLIFIERFKSVDINEIIFFDYVFAYSTLLLLRQENISIENYYENIQNFRNLVSVHATFSPLNEQYFGLLISKALNFSINEDTFLNFVSRNRGENIVDTFYYLLIFQELERDISEESRNSIINLFNEFIIKGEVENSSLRGLYYFVRTAHILNIQIPNNEYLKILDIIEEFRENSERILMLEHLFFYYVSLKEIMEFKIEPEFLVEYIRGFYTEGRNFSMLRYDDTNSNIISTFNMMSLIQKYDLDIGISNSNVLEVLRYYRGFNGGFFIMNPEISEVGLKENYRYNFSLESWWFGLYLYNYLSEYS